jgi:leucyl aminopeptidase
MEFLVTDTPPSAWTGDALAIGLFEDALELTQELAQLDEKLAGTLKELLLEVDFKGKAGTSAITRVGGNNPIRKIAIVGLGKKEELKLDTVRQAAGVGAKLAKKEKCKTLGISFPVWKNAPDSTASAIAEGVELSLNQDNRFKSEHEDKSPQLEQIHLLGLAGT